MPESGVRLPGGLVEGLLVRPWSHAFAPPAAVVVSSVVETQLALKTLAAKIDAQTVALEAKTDALEAKMDAQAAAQAARTDALMNAFFALGMGGMGLQLWSARHARP
jgi:hypothetical protein